MANYGYIRFERPITTPELDAAITVNLMCGWQVRRAPWEDGGPTWEVFIPGTEPKDRRDARDRCLAMGQPVGFCVSLQDDGRTIAVRHGPNAFERWAQGCMEEALADEFGVGIYYDTTDETMPVGHRWYRRGATFYEYLINRLPSPATEADIAWVKRHAYCVPPGFDAGFDEKAR